MGRRILSLLVVVAVCVVGLPLSPWVPAASAETWSEQSRTLVSIYPDGTPAAAADTEGQVAQISNDGNRVLFSSSGTQSGFYVRDIGAAVTVRVDVLPDGAFGANGFSALSDNGRYVVFAGPCGGTAQQAVYRRDIDAGVTVRVNTRWDGVASCEPEDVGTQWVSGISPNGRLIVVFGQGRYFEDSPPATSGGAMLTVFNAETGQRWAVDPDGNPGTGSGGCASPASNFGRLLTDDRWAYPPGAYGSYQANYYAASWPYLDLLGQNDRVTVSPSGDDIQVACTTIPGFPITDSDVRYFPFRDVEGNWYLRDIASGWTIDLQTPADIVSGNGRYGFFNEGFDLKVVELLTGAVGTVATDYAISDSSYDGQYLLVWPDPSGVSTPGWYVTNTGAKAPWPPPPPDQQPPTPAPGDPGGDGSIDPDSKKGGGSCSTSDSSTDAGNPVDTQTGNKYDTWQDIAIPGRTDRLRFERTYNSADASRNGPLGYGWSTNLHSHVEFDSGTGQASIVECNGAEMKFWQDPVAPDTFRAAPRVQATLVREADGSWTYEVRNNLTHRYDAAGRLVWEEDRNGNRISVTYPDGDTEVWSDEAGRTLTLDFAGGRVTTVTDNATPPRQVRYEYDGAGNLTDVYDVAGGNWRYTYDGSHRLETRRSPRQSAKSTDQRVYRYSYDSQGRAFRQVDEEGHEILLDFDSVAGATVVTENRGDGQVIRRLDRYEHGLLVEQIHGYGSADETSTQYRYDPDVGGLTWIEDGNGNVTTQDFDERGNLRYRRDPLGREWYWDYNEFNEPTFVVAPDGHMTTNTYDTAGNLTQTDVEYRASVLGSPVERTITTEFHRDDPAHPEDVTSMTDAAGKTWTYGYDQYGYRSSVTTPLGRTSTEGFDNVGRRLWSRAAEGNEPGDETDPVEQERWTTHYETNGFGDVTNVTDPLDNETVTDHDANRNVRSVTDAKGETTTYVYDETDRLTEEHRPGTEGTVLRTEYWEDGLLEAQIDGAGARTEYFYDAVGRVERVEDPLDRATSYTYDDSGNVETVTDAESQVTTMSYDEANQLTGVDYSDPDTADVTGIVYDSMGRRTRVTDGTGTSTWTYDTAGQVTSYTNGAGKTVQHVYDDRGLVSQVHYPDGAEQFRFVWACSADQLARRKRRLVSCR